MLADYGHVRGMGKQAVRGVIPLVVRQSCLFGPLPQIVLLSIHPSSYRNVGFERRAQLTGLLDECASHSTKLCGGNPLRLHLLKACIHQGSCRWRTIGTMCKARAPDGGCLRITTIR